MRQTQVKLETGAFLVVGGYSPDSATLHPGYVCGVPATLFPTD